jgi:hypothetical protein
MVAIQVLLSMCRGIDAHGVGTGRVPGSATGDVERGVAAARRTLEVTGVLERVTGPECGNGACRAGTLRGRG